MAVNKVVYGGNTLIDLTEDTVTPDTLVKGMTAHDAAGNPITGTYDGVTRTEFTNELNTLQQTIPTKTSDITNDSGFVNETFVNQKVTDLVNSAPETLDTLGEVAQALQENENVVDALNKAIGNKVDKVDGKGLSTNDYTTEEKEKLNEIEVGANKTVVDDILNDTSTNPIQNKIITKNINKINKDIEGKADKTELFDKDYNSLNNKPTIPSVDTELSTSSTNAVQNKVVSVALNKKANDFSIELYNGNKGNPQPVKFITVDYSSCNSENGVAIKLGMVSGHGNGSSYAFLQDAIIKVTHTGTVTVDNFKYYGAATGTYEGVNRQYGDIFWVHNADTKIVDFYVLMGQYARVQMTPWKRVTYSTGGSITQYNSATVYSEGTKEWGNNSEFAMMSDLSNYAKLASSNNLLHDGNEFTFVPSGYSGQVYINHKTAGGANGNITNYYFGDGKGGLATFIANYFYGKFQGDTPRPIYNNEEAAMLSDVNALKPTITVDTTSGDKSLTLTTGNSNSEWRYTNASGITSLTLNDSGTFDASTEAYYTVIFISGLTATTITNIMDAHFTGDDCTDGVFTPVANKTYEVGIWWNGLMWQAVVKGV